MDDGGSLSRFDWYQGSFPEQARMTAVDVLAPLGDEAPKRIAGMHAYHRGWDIRRQGTSLCRVYEGRGLTDHFVASGSDAPEIARCVRIHATGHRVSRADVCLDFQRGGSFFDSTRDLIVEELAGRVTLTEYVETGLREKSSTLYVGSRKSETRVRLYEKGKQDTTYAVDTVRLELQARPGKQDRKVYASQLDPDGFWGMARWSRWMVEALAGLAVVAAPPRSARVSDLDRALDAMALQYGKRILEQAQRLDGDLEALALDLIARIPQANLGGDGE